MTILQGPETPDPGTQYPTGPGGAMTPVPTTFQTTTIYVDPNTGNWWVYSVNQQGWVFVGLPYST